MAILIPSFQTNPLPTVNKIIPPDSGRSAFRQFARALTFGRAWGGGKRNSIGVLQTTPRINLQAMCATNVVYGCPYEASMEKHRCRPHFLRAAVL